MNAKKEDTEIKETTANNSPKKFKVRGKLRLNNNKNKRITLDWKSKKKSESIFLE